MKMDGYAFQLTDGSDVYIAPQSGVDFCKAVHDDFEISIDLTNGSFIAKNIGDNPAALGVIEFKKAVFEVPDGGRLTDEDEGNVGIAWCRASGCCCNCGAGWICG